MGSCRNFSSSLERTVAARFEITPGSRGLSSDTNSVQEKSTTPSRSAPSPTSSVTSIDGQNRDDGLLQLQPPHLESHHKELICPLTFLNCKLSFNVEDFDRWYAHSISHFGTHQPPINTICIFCNTSFQNDDPWRCWWERMHHIADHFDDGNPIEHPRSDFALLYHLRANNLITSQQYVYAIRAQEVLFTEGLKPSDWIPEDRRFQKLKEERRANQVVVKGKTEKRRRHKRGSPACPDRALGLVLPTAVQNGHSSSQPEKPAEAAVEYVSAERSNGEDEAIYFLRDPSSQLLDTDISSDDDLSDTVSLLEVDDSTSLPKSLPTDVDLDEDLIDPDKHYKQLRAIQDKAFRNSTALQLDYLPRVELGDSISDSCTECCDMLRRIWKNVHTLQEHGFCQSQLSLLKVNPQRSNVALLVAILVDTILQLGVAFELGQASKSQQVPITSSHFVQRLQSKSVENKALQSRCPRSTEYDAQDRNQFFFGRSSVSSAHCAKPLLQDLPYNLVYRTGVLYPVPRPGDMIRRGLVRKTGLIKVVRAQDRVVAYEPCAWALRLEILRTRCSGLTVCIL